MSKLHSQQRSKSAKKAEKGQAIILVAFMMVGLIAMLGLVVDGGGLMYLQRDVQNTVDDAVVAATYAKCVNGNVTAAAVNAAKRNGFENGVNGATVTVNSPPASGPAAGNTDFVEVIIIAQKQPYFIQIVHNDTLSVTARAVGQCVPSTTNSSGKALFGISQTCNNTVKSTGATSTIVGGLHSNNDVLEQGSSHTISGGSSYVSSANTSGTYTPPIQQSSVKADPGASLFKLNDYDIDQNGVYALDAQGKGRYRKYVGSTPVLTETELAAYDLIYATGDINISAKTEGSYNVTFVAEGNIEMQQGNGKNLFLAPAYNHLLFFANSYGVAACNTNAIKLSLSESSWEGVMYAPNGAADLSMSGNSTLNGAIWAYSVAIQAADSTVIFDNSWMPPDPPKIALPE